MKCSYLKERGTARQRNRMSECLLVLFFNNFQNFNYYAKNEM